MKKRFISISFAFLLLIFGVSITAFAQDSARETIQVSSIDLGTIPLNYVGEYDGYSTYGVTRRAYALEITDIENNGDIKGIATISYHATADQKGQENAKYYFKGHIDKENGKITLQGYEWIQYPDAEGNHTFFYFEGTLDSKTGEIKGKSEHGIWRMSSVDKENLNGGVVFNGHTYWLYNTEGTWEEAKKACEDKGGHLVTITSSEEQKFLEGLIKKGTKNSYWIGAKKTNGMFSSWITNEPFKYSNFDFGEPNNKNGNENALLIYRLPNPMVSGSQSYKWDDLYEGGTCDTEPFFGTENIGYICEWDSNLSDDEPANTISSSDDITCFALSNLVYSDHLDKGDGVDEFKSDPATADDPLENTQIKNKNYGELYGETLDGWTVDKEYPEKGEDEGFYAVRFYNKKENRYILSFKGSKELEDFGEDAIHILLNKTTEQIGKALEVAEENKNKDIIFTGHSLGGALATVAAYETNKPSKTFNSTPLTDVSFYRMPYLLGSSFKGIDKLSALDFVNEHDHAGTYELDYKKAEVHKDLTPNYNPFKLNEFHSQRNMLTYNSGKFTLSDIVSKEKLSEKSKMVKNITYLGIDSKYQPLLTALCGIPGVGIFAKITQALSVIPKGTLVLGTSSKNNLSGTDNPLNDHPEVIYGGDGVDSIDGHYGDDFIVGGSGDDTLNGGAGDDFYFYNAGDGKDSITDIDGNDSIVIFDREGNSGVSVDKGNGCINVKLGSKTVMEIKDLKNDVDDGGKVNVYYVGKEICDMVPIPDSWWTQIDSEVFEMERFGPKTAKSAAVMATDSGQLFDIEIYDPAGNHVLTLSDGEEKTYNNDFGTFSVREEDGAYVKYLTFYDPGCSYKVVGKGTGTISVSKKRSNGDGYETCTADSLSVSKGSVYSGSPTEKDLKSLSGGGDIVLSTETEIPVESVSVSKDEMPLGVGASEQLAVNIAPENATNKELTIENSNPNVVSYADGTVTGLMDGEATLTFTASNGKTASCIVKVGTGETASSLIVYRLYNPSSNEHLFTTDENEYRVLGSQGWAQEGKGWTSPASGDPVYRLYSPVTGAHLYTKDENEVNTLLGNGNWQADNDRKPLMYSGGSGNVYRLYHEGIRMHLLTTDENEYNVLGGSGWNQEGVALNSIG